VAAIRLSIVVPSPGQRQRVEQLLDHLDERLGKNPHYVVGGRFEATDGSGEIGRISVWESEADADHAATDDDVIAIRSQIHMLVQPGHLERLYKYVGHGDFHRLAQMVAASTDGH